MRDSAKPYDYDNNNIQRKEISPGLEQLPVIEEASTGVAWPAVIGGAIAATAISLLLLFLGAGVGLSTASPLLTPGAAADTSIMGTPVKTIVWLVAMQIIASGFGGYLTGRLRTKWINLNKSEIFFRDTANGFLSWAVATIIAAVLFASAASLVINSSIRTMSAAIVPMFEEGGNMANTSIPVSIEGLLGPNSYLIAGLFRSDSLGAIGGESSVDAREEASNIVINGIRSGGMSDTDRTLLAQIVMAQTGISQGEAISRVDDTTAQITKSTTDARQTIDAAMKVSSYFAFVVCISMLVGAFVASYSAALGGKHRDNAYVE